MTKKAKDFIREKIHIDKENKLYNFIKIMITFTLINFTWIFFRADSLEGAISIIKSIFTNIDMTFFTQYGFLNLGLNMIEIIILLATILILIAVDYANWKGETIREYMYKQKIGIRWAFYIFSIMFVLIFGIWGSGFNANAFIYFQF